MYLYIDTSQQSTIGLLSEDYEWLELKHSERKASFLQSEIASLLEKRNQQFSDIKKIYYSAGPGSYTGMRITEGFIGTLEILGIEAHGFYLFDLLNILKLENACWISSAFKGEYFLAKNQKTLLLNEAEASDFAKENQGNIYSFNGEEFFNQSTKSLQKILKENPRGLQSVKGNKKPYYYRPLEKEFSVKKT